MKMMNDVQVKRPVPRPIMPTVKIEKRRQWIDLRLRLPRLRFARKPVHFVVAAVLLAGVIGPTWEAIQTAAKYQLTAATQRVVATPASTILPKLKYDSATKAYVISTESSNAAGQSTSLGGGGYKAIFPTTASQGITIQDNSTNLSLSFTPLDNLLDAKLKSGHIVYPAADTPTQVLYTVKANGVKEDVVIQHEIGDQAQLRYQLNLPQTLEARLLPDGSLGIYSAPSSLFGNNVQAGSAADQQLLDQARSNNDNKTNLAFVIPAPTVNQSGGRTSARPVAKFALDGNILTVNVSGLAHASYPLSIDPTFVVTSVGDFQTGNSEDNSMYIDQTNNQAYRWMSGGTAGTWASNSALAIATYGFSMMVYNGHVYMSGGNQQGQKVYYTTISSSGSIGSTWSTAPTTSFVHSQSTMLEYNGYLYDIGGVNSSTAVAQVEYAKINLDGSVGSWVQTSSLVTGRWFSAGAAYNGHLYMVGGCNAVLTLSCTSVLSSSEYATVKPDGSLTSWATTSGGSFSQARQLEGVSAYNGVVYLAGGQDPTSGGSGAHSDVQYAHITSTGDLGAWTTASSALPQTLYGASANVANGYMYVLGGGVSGGDANVVYYAQINADGTLGSWLSLNAFSGVRRIQASFIYNNMIYVGGGCSGTCAPATILGDIQSASIDPANTPRFGATTSAIPTALWGGYTFVAKGFIYVVGGCTAAPTYVSGALQPCPAANIWGHGADSGHTQGTSGDRLNIAWAHLNFNGTIDTSYTVSGYTFTNGWAMDQATCTENTNLTLDDCPGARYGFAAVYYNSALWIISGRGGDGNGTLNGQSNGNSVTADVNFITFRDNGSLTLWTDGSNDRTGCSGANRLTTAREFATADADEGYFTSLYVMGGRNSSGTPLATAEFSNNNCTWQAITASMPTARWQAAMASYNGRLYAIGGRGSGSTVYNSIVESSNQDVGSSRGSSTTWSTLCSPCSGLPSNGIYGATAYAYKNLLYVVGGVTDGTDGPPSTYSSTIYTAAISPDGSIGTFSAGSTNMTVAHYLGGSAFDADNGTLYVTGGVSASSTVTATTDMAHINNGGAGGVQWTGSVGSDTGVQRSGADMAQYQNFVYLVGGYNGSYLNSVQVGTIDQSSGNVTWATQSQTLPVNDAYGGAFVANGFLYVVGGRQDDSAGADVTSKIYRAPINTSTGQLSGSFIDMDTLSPTNSMNLTVPREFFGLGVVNGYVYAIGGVTWPGGTETQVGDYDYAPINSDGTLGTFTNVSSAATPGLAGGATTYDGNIYIGDLAVSCQTCGTGGTANTYTSEAQKYTPNPSTHLLTGTVLDGGRFDVEENMVAYNGFLYHLGGSPQQGNGNTSPAASKVEAAPIISDGSMAYRTWQWTNDMTSTAGSPDIGHETGRFLSSDFAYNGKIYVVGGCFTSQGLTETSGGFIIRNYCQSGYYSTEIHGSLQSIPRVAHYSKLLDSDLDVAPTKLLTNGTLSTSNSAVSLSYETSTSANGSTGFSSPQNLSLSFGTPASIATDTGGLDRYYWLDFTVDDSQSAVFPDSPTTITDFTLYFHPNPSRRLRGGASFVGGNCRVSPDSADNSSNCSLDGSP